MEIDAHNRRIIEAAIHRQLGEREVLIEGVEVFIEDPAENVALRYEIGGETRRILDAGEPLEEGHVVTLNAPTEEV